MKNLQKWSVALFACLLLFAGQVSAALTLDQGPLFSTDYDNGGMGSGRGLGFHADENFSMSTFAIDLSVPAIAAVREYKFEIFSSGDGHTAGALLASTTFYLSEGEGYQHQPFSFNFAAGSYYVINFSRVDGGALAELGTHYSRESGYVPYDYGILTVVEGFEGASPNAGNSLVPHVELSLAELLASDQFGNLISIDLLTGSGTLIGQELGFPLSTEIEFDPNTGILYSDETNGDVNLHTIDLATGLSTGFVTHPCCALNGMEFVDATLYATNNDGAGGFTLVTVDPATGVYTPIGPTGMPPITGLAYDTTTSTLFGVTAGGGVAGGAPAQLVTVDLTTGVATPVAPLLDVAGAPLDKVGSIEFGPDGVLYGGTGLTSTVVPPGMLISIDTQTGTSTVIGPTGLAGITGLTLAAAAVVPMPDLTISILDSPDPVAAGTELTYTIRVDNIGDAVADGVVVTTIGPAAYQLVSTTGCAEDPGGMTTCSLGSIAPGGYAEYTLTVLVHPSLVGPIHNIATVTTSSTESDDTNNSATAETLVNAEADLSITKAADSGVFISGGNRLLTYTIEVSNAGPSDATNVVVTDDLPSQVIPMYTNGCLNDPMGVPVCELGTIPAGGSASYSIGVRVLRFGGLLQNSVSVTSDASDSTPGNDVVSAAVEVEPIEIPTLNKLGLLVLILLMSSIGWAAIRRF